MSNEYNKAPPTQTPLDGLLSDRIIRILVKNGVDSVEGVRQAYPLRLLRMHGIGMMRLRHIEMAFFPDQCYEPDFAPPSIRFAQDSSLNGRLPLVTVRTLARAGIKTPEQLREAYPHKLLKIHTIGARTLREIERVFFPGQRFPLKEDR
ncbi:helix-hairpin-helix domain-containing protein [Comamonas koreensis]|uniref:Helix-hairpin-helix domain-containing protein n=1 Tax=Comamonas koreensis TaxID=160825 RepID=A0AAW4XXF6_9BURK|nr:helix-hairpin-helix domain-containing protein [Comamonas koreensis]MCD2165825.1 helix-hairpin-helix domain-containing protein [Comamonas koreensis]